LFFFGAILNPFSHELFLQRSGAAAAGSKIFDYAGRRKGSGRSDSNWGFSLVAASDLKAQEKP
jgi:hypothetical protein